MAIDPNIPLQARPPQIQSPLEAMGQATALRNAQIQTQTGQINLQEQQRALAAQQALDSAYGGALRPDGTLDDNALLSHLPGSVAVKVLPQLTAAKKAVADLQDAQLKVAQHQTDLIAGMANGVVESGYDPQTFLQAIRTARDTGLITPEAANQHAVGAIEQGPAYIKQTTDNYLAQSKDWQTALAQKTNATARAMSAQTGAARLQAELPQIQARTAKTQAELSGTLPPTPAQQATIAQGNERIAIARQNLALQLRKQGFDESQGLNADDPNAKAAIDMLGTYMASTGSMPPGFRVYGKNSAGFYTAVAADAAAKVKAGGGSLASTAAGFTADKAALVQQQKMYDAASAFFTTADKNAALLEQTLKTIPDVHSPVFNRPLRAFAVSVQGDPNLSQFATYLTSVQNEYAKILNNPNLAGSLTDAARRETQQLINPAATVPQIVASIQALRTEGRNRLDAIHDQIQTIQKRIGTGGQTPPKDDTSRTDPLGILKP